MFLDSGLNTVGACSCAGHQVHHRGFIILFLGFWMLAKLSISIVLLKYICSVIII